MAAFFERLLGEEDPSRFATMAENLPEPPTFEGLVARAVDESEAVAEAEAVAEPVAEVEPTAVPRPKPSPRPTPSRGRRRDGRDRRDAAETEPTRPTRAGRRRPARPRRATDDQAEPTAGDRRGRRGVRGAATARSTARPPSPRSRPPPRPPRAPRSRPTPPPAPRPSPTSRSRSSATTRTRPRPIRASPRSACRRTTTPPRPRRSPPPARPTRGDPRDRRRRARRPPRRARPGQGQGRRRRRARRPRSSSSGSSASRASPASSAISAASPGVQSVGVSSGPDGEFVFAVNHAADVVLRDAIPSLPELPGPRHRLVRRRRPRHRPRSGVGRVAGRAGPPRPPHRSEPGTTIVARPAIVIALPPASAGPSPTSCARPASRRSPSARPTSSRRCSTTRHDIAVAILDGESDFDTSLEYYGLLHEGAREHPGADGHVAAGARQDVQPDSADEFFSRPYTADSIRWRVEAMCIRSVTVDDGSGPIIQGGSMEMGDWSRRATVIAIFNPKGGVGKTTIATNLASALQLHQRPEGPPRSTPTP